MNITFAARKAEIDDKFKERTQIKLDKFDRFFDDASASVTVTQERERITVEITIKSKGQFFRSEHTSAEPMESLEKVTSTLTRQIVKQKSRLTSRLRTGAFDDLSIHFPEVASQEEDDDYQIVKTKSVSAKPMLVDEAILQMNLLGHPFFLFQNADTGEINTVYKRNDGNYGLIEPEFG